MEHNNTGKIHSVGIKALYQQKLTAYKYYLEKKKLFAKAV